MGRAATAAAARPTRTGSPGSEAPEHGGWRRRAAARPTWRRRRHARAAGMSAAVDVPARLLNAPFARALRARTARVLDALLSGRGWIALIGVLLAGIVFFNVDLLQMNRDIARDADRASALKRENARLRLDVARLASSERIQEAAAKLGLVLPAPGEVRYLKARPLLDARRAAKRITEPNPSLLPPAPISTAPEATLPPSTTTTPPATTTPPPTGTTTPPPTGTTTPPATTTTPPATTTPPSATTPGGTVSPQAPAPGAVPQATAPAGTPQTTTGQTAPFTTGQPAP